MHKDRTPARPLHLIWRQGQACRTPLPVGRHGFNGSNHAGIYQIFAGIFTAQHFGFMGGIKSNQQHVIGTRLLWHAIQRYLYAAPGCGGYGYLRRV